MDKNFIHKYPYTNFHELNLDWIISKINEFESRLDTIQEDIEQNLKEYVEEYVKILRKDFDDFKNDVNIIISNLTDDMSAYKDEINNYIANFDNRIKQIENDFISYKTETALYLDARFISMREEIINAVNQNYENIKVINFFTGEKVTLQNMFDYLAMLHIENPFTNNNAIALNITYDDAISKAGSRTIGELLRNAGDIFTN